MYTIIVGGAPACGKTSMIRHLINYLQQSGFSPAVCKIDCIQSNDDLVYQAMDIPVAKGLCQDMCPDHFLATNIIDIFAWSVAQKATHLIIETAGLCNRCAPFINRALNICVIDALGSIKGPEKLGPLVTTADILVLTKCDLISQSEREVLSYHLFKLNPQAFLLEVNGLSGFGTQRLGMYLKQTIRAAVSLEEDRLRYTMPTANCAYCVGEIRIGKAYQQGITHRMTFGKEESANVT